MMLTPSIKFDLLIFSSVELKMGKWVHIESGKYASVEHVLSTVIPAAYGK